MATDSGNESSEPTVRLTVRELVELYGKQTVSEVRDLKSRVQELDGKVDDLDASVAAIKATQVRDDVAGGQASLERSTRHGQIIAVVGVAFSIIISIANMAALLVISHGG